LVGPLVVEENFDVVGHGFDGLGVGGEDGSVDEFLLERRKNDSATALS